MKRKFNSGLSDPGVLCNFILFLFLFFLKNRSFVQCKHVFAWLETNNICNQNVAGRLYSISINIKLATALGQPR